MGPLAPLLAFFAGGLLFLSLTRAGLALAHLARVRRVVGFWRLFPIGVRMDSMTLSMALFAPALALLVLPRRGRRLWGAVVGAYLAGVAGLMIFMEAATAPFLAQYDSRPNRIFIDYLAYPHEVLGTIWAGYKLPLLLALALAGAGAWATWRAVRRLVAGAWSWSYRARLLALPLVGAVLFLAARSSLSQRAANISTAAFSGDHLVNELALNSTYSVGYAVYRRETEIDPRGLYGGMPRAEVIARVRRQMLLPPEAFPRTDVPLWHRQTSARRRSHPYNIVILLEESLGAEYVGCLGGLPLTPNLDSLAAQGMLLTNLYATGTRTVRGIEATLSGFLPMAGDAVVKRGLSQGRFFTLAGLLRRKGYATEFIYGGESHFDNMRGFFLADGFARVLDQPFFTHPVFTGVWGVSDEDLLGRANAVFAAHGHRPFFALVLTTSNHKPFGFPPGRIALYERPARRRENAIEYADYALGEFFRRARQEPYFARTIFLVVADHDTRVFGAGLVPVEKFHIVGLILGPGVPRLRYEGLASQVDLAPTLIDLAGLDVEHPMVGRDLLEVAPGVPGHAFMQYYLANAYRVGEQVVVSRPFRWPRQFAYRDGRLVPVALDPELGRDALAHILLPALLYHERSYHRPLPHPRRRRRGWR